MMLVCKEWKEVLTVEFLWREAVFPWENESGSRHSKYNSISTLVDSLRTSRIRSNHTIESFTLCARISPDQCMSLITELSFCKDWLKRIDTVMISDESFAFDLVHFRTTFPKLQHLNLNLKGSPPKKLEPVSEGRLSFLSIGGKCKERWTEEDLEWVSELKHLGYTPHGKPYKVISDFNFQIIQRCRLTLVHWEVYGYGPFSPIDATLNLPALKSISFDHAPENLEILETMQIPNLKEAGGQVGTLLHLPANNLQAIKIHFKGNETSHDLIKLVGLHQSSLTRLSLTNNWNRSLSLIIDPLFQFLKPDLLQGIKCPNLSHLVINPRFERELSKTFSSSLLLEVLQARNLAVISLLDEEGNSLYPCSKLALILSSKERLEEFRELELEAITKVPSGLREVIGKVEVKSLS